MKSFYYLILFFLIVNTSPAFPQLIISEYSSGISLAEANYLNQYTNENFSTVINTQNQRMLVSNEVENASDDANALLNINLEYVNSDQVTVVIYNENYVNVLFTTDNVVSFNLPDGTYDCLVSFQFQEKNSIVIKELVNVSGNTNITVNINEAANKVVHEIVNESNEKLRPGVNSRLLINSAEIFFIPMNTLLTNYLNFWGNYGNPNEDPAWTFYISDVSERYQILNYTHGIANERVHYFPIYEPITGVSDNVEMTNDNGKFVYHEEFMEPTQVGENSTLLRPVVSSHRLFKNQQFSVGTYIENEFPLDRLFKAYVSSDINTEQTPNLASFGFLEDRINTSTYFYLRGNTISLENNEIIYGSANMHLHWNFLGFYNLIAEPGQSAFPFHSKFLFPASNAPEIQQGTNVPIISTGLKERILLSSYTGRYAESRESDFITTTAQVFRDGELILNGSYLDLQNTGFFASSKYEINLINTNTKIDGINGKNTAQIIFDNNLEDRDPPSLKMLQFRTEDGIVKDRFQQNEIPVARIAAGDFYFDNAYIKYKAGNLVQFLYSKMNEENWNEVELINYPEHFRMPGYGDYYEASLAGIQSTGNDVWYDVKVICTDAAGNKQIQTISPAFKLNSTLQTEEIEEEYNFMVYPNPFNDNLNILLPKNIKGDYVVKLTDMTGKVISSTNKKSTDSKSLFFSFLPQGTYVISIESNGNTLTKKVIKK